MNLADIQKITARITSVLFGVQFKMYAALDAKGGDRVYIQAHFTALCTHTGVKQDWHGRKWYLSEHMTVDEIIKTCYAAFKTAVEHEVMESFKVDGIILFNPHLNYERLLEISHHEVSST